MSVFQKKKKVEWMNLFEEYQTEAKNLQNDILLMDKEIDKKVYELYGLTEEEIKIVEESNN